MSCELGIFNLSILMLQNVNIDYLLVKIFRKAPLSSTIGTALICAGKEKEKNQY